MFGKQSILMPQYEPFVLPPELFLAMQYIHDNFANISPNIRSKLNFLALHLLKNHAQEEQKSYFSLIREERDSPKVEEKSSDLSILEPLSPEILTKVYFDTVNTLFPKNNLQLTGLIKRGSLQIRSQTLKLWGERSIELNFGQQILIIKKSSPRKPDKTLDLNTYSLRWLGEVKSRFCFALDSKTPKNHYKCFFIGSEVLEISREWHEFLRVSQNSCYISSFLEHRNKLNRLRRSVSPQRKGEDEKRAKKEVKTLKIAKEELEKRGGLKIALPSSEELESVNKSEKNERNERKVPASAPHNSSLFKFEFSTELRENNNEESPTFQVLKEECLKSPFAKEVENYQQKQEEKAIRKNIQEKRGEESFRRKYNVLGRRFAFLRRSLREARNRKNASRGKTSRNPAKTLKSIKKKRVNLLFFAPFGRNSGSLLQFCPFYPTAVKNIPVRFAISRNLLCKDGKIYYTSGSNPSTSSVSARSEAGFLDFDVKHVLNLKVFLNKIPYKKLINSENLTLFRHKTRAQHFKQLISLPKSPQTVIPYFVNDSLYGLWNKNLASRREVSLNRACNSSIFVETRAFFSETREKFAFQRYFFENPDFFVVFEQNCELCEEKPSETLTRVALIDKRYEENGNYTRVLMDFEFLARRPAINLRHFFLQEFKNIALLRKVLNERTSLKRIGNLFSIGLRRPLSYERKAVKKPEFEGKRLVSGEKTSVFFENHDEELHFSRFFDDMFVKTPVFEYSDANFFEIWRKSQENAEDFPEKLDFSRLWRDFLIDSADFWRLTREKTMILRDKRLLNAQNKLIDFLKKAFFCSKGLPISFINLDFPIVLQCPQTLHMELLRTYLSAIPTLLFQAGSNNNSQRNSQSNCGNLSSFKKILQFLLKLLRNSLFSLPTLNSLKGEILEIFLEKREISIKIQTLRASPRQIQVNVAKAGVFSVKAVHEVDYLLTNRELKIKSFKNVEVEFVGCKAHCSQFPILSVFDEKPGQRTAHFDGNLVVNDKKTGLSSLIQFGSAREEDFLLGNQEILRGTGVKTEVEGQIFQEFSLEEELKDNESLCEIRGIWPQYVEFSDEERGNTGKEESFMEFFEGESVRVGKQGRKDWVLLRNGGWEEAQKVYDALKGKEKIRRWYELKNNAKASFY